MKKRTAILIAAIALPTLLNLYSCKHKQEKILTMIDFVKIDKDTKLDTVLNSFIGPLVFSPVLYRDYVNGEFQTQIQAVLERKWSPLCKEGTGAFFLQKQQGKAKSLERAFGTLIDADFHDIPLLISARFNHDLGESF